MTTEELFTLLSQFRQYRKDFMTKLVEQDPFTQNSYALALLYGIGVPDNTTKELTQYFLRDSEYNLSLTTQI